MIELIEAWQGKKVLVIGDPIIDDYRFGRVDRLSPEAPVPVFVETHRSTRRGGALNVFENLNALGCNATFHGPPSEKLWSKKTRYVVGTHQLLRVDDDVIHHLNHAPEASGYDAIVLSDYAKGACSEDLCREIMHVGPPVIVDPKLPDWSKFIGCTVICPNFDEYMATHHGCRDLGLGKEFTSLFDEVLIKSGERGITRKSTTAGWEDYPAQARHVFDVTGAGDVVVAVVAATLAAKGSLQDACRLANLAAGWSVGEVGTVSVPKEKLCELVLQTASLTAPTRDTNTSLENA